MKLPKLLRTRVEGASLLTYGLLVGLISVVAIAAVTSSGSSINSLFGETNQSLEAVVASTSGGAGGETPEEPDPTPQDPLAFGSSAIVSDGDWEVSCGQWGSEACIDPLVRNGAGFAYITSCPYTSHGLVDPTTDWSGLHDTSFELAQHNDCMAWCRLAGHTTAIATSETAVSRNLVKVNFFSEGTSPAGTGCTDTSPLPECCTTPAATTNDGSSIAFGINVRTGSQNWSCRCDGWP